MKDFREIIDAFPKRLARDVGRAVMRWSMIRAGDRIAVGLSGGKDSLTLLVALARLRARLPFDFDLGAICIDPAGNAASFDDVVSFAKDLGVTAEVVDHPIFDVIKKSGTASPCSLCANMRRGALAAAAVRLGYGTLALGHHLDDAVETAMLNLLYGGKWSCFEPAMTMSRTGVRVIRPLVLAPEASIAGAAKRLSAPILDLGCEYAEASMRAVVKDEIDKIAAFAPSVKKNILHALIESVWR